MISEEQVLADITWHITNSCPLNGPHIMLLIEKYADVLKSKYEKQVECSKEMERKSIVFDGIKELLGGYKCPT